MKHKVKISVSDTPQAGGIITCRNVGIRERILRFLLGDKRKITVLVPRESVGEIAICEAEKGEVNILLASGENRHSESNEINQSESKDNNHRL